MYVFVSVSESWQEYRPELVSRAAWLIETSFIIVLVWFHWNWHINGTWTCNIRIVSLSVRLSLCRSVSQSLYWSGLHLYFSIYIYPSVLLFVRLSSRHSAGSSLSLPIFLSLPHSRCDFNSINAINFNFNFIERLPRETRIDSLFMILLLFIIIGPRIGVGVGGEDVS